MKKLHSLFLTAILMVGMQSPSMANGEVHPLSKAKNKVHTAKDNPGEAGLLSNAYHILETGDHDYNGHRVKAMHAIEEAAKPLGVNLHGDARDKSPQALSDAKLHEVIGMLQTVHGAAKGKHAEHIQKHIKKAIKELNEALSIR